MLTQISISETIQQQRDYFLTGKPKDINFRLQQLQILKQLVIENETAIVQALQADLHKPEFEAVSAEIILIIKDIELAIKNLKNWTRPQKVAIPWQLLPASAKIQPEPLGVVLIIGAWNYPFSLIIMPLVGAIAAGNCAILKPSEIAVNASNLLTEIIPKYFDSQYISVVAGGVEISQKLLAEKFDHIFFTGSPHIGKIIMEAAAKHLTPVTLELGGKNPCIVDADVHLEHATRRIIWGKFFNAGQTCLAPDYLLVDRKIKNQLLEIIKNCLQEFFGTNPVLSPDYARIVNQRHFTRLVNLLQNGKIIIGGESNIDQLYIAPTVIDHVSFTDAIMQEEIFGPILPIIEYTNLEEAINWINSQPKPLVLYLFSQNQNLQQQVVQTTSSGAVCLNETIIHYTVSSLPFGGVGNSGMGKYHGKASFEIFSHYKTVWKNPLWLDIKLRYAPYKGKLSIFRQLFRF
jgi:acyl-CoA reductase-like NAD-dependent aldehyde dehydrogenase